MHCPAHPCPHGNVVEITARLTARLARADWDDLTVIDRCLDRIETLHASRRLGLDTHGRPWPALDEALLLELTDVRLEREQMQTAHERARDEAVDALAVPRTRPMINQDPDSAGVVTLHEGDATWHGGPGWYYTIDDYPDEGSCGAFASRVLAEQHARLAGHTVPLAGPADADMIGAPDPEIVDGAVVGGEA